ncbi:MAG: LPP20 family lipoprotein [Campylobacterota bacterium]|nr:LPP20 family lipoprotein [Campylobacterota bacterium]
MTYTHLLVAFLLTSFALVGCAPMPPEAAEQNNVTQEAVITKNPNSEAVVAQKKETRKPHQAICQGTISTIPYYNNTINGTHPSMNHLSACHNIRVSVIGQGVSPVNTTSPAQAYALAKRAAVADAYRSIAEKISGVHVEGHDTIKNMMVTRSEVKTQVNSLIRNAHVAETTFKEGLCEVEMEIVLTYSNIVL